MSLDDSDYKKKVQQSEDLAKKFSFNLSKAWDTAKAGAAMAAGAVTAVTGALAGASAATEEYRVAQGKLNTAFEAAGYSSDTATAAYSEFYKILGDTDTATEASQLLAQLAENEQDMETWTRTAAGVWGTFGDSLPIEGLIESANETAKVGQVTGSLADALNWVGISEDEFNEKLEAAGSEAERNRLIMETLSATYDGAADAFYRNNEQIIQNRENQQKLTDIMARVGDAFDRVRGALIEKFAPALEEIGNKVADFLEGFDVDAAVNAAERLVNGFVALLPVIAGVAAAVETFKAAMAISAIIDGAIKAYKAFEAATKGASVAQWLLNAAMAANPIVLIVTLIAGLVAALVVLWTTNEDFRNAVTAAWQSVLDFISGVVDSLGNFFTETLPNAFNVVVDFFKNNWQNILLFLVNPFAGAFKLLYDNFEGFRNAVDTLLENIKNAFSNLATSIGETVGNIKDAIVNGIQKAIDFIVELPGRALEWGRDFIGGFVDGIRSMIDSVVDAVSSVADTVTSWLHFSRPDVGPLREYETWMPDMMQGLAKGIDGNIWRIRDSMANVAGVMADSLGATVTTGGNMAVHHSGTIRIEGVNNRGEFVAASNYSVEQALAGILRKQART